MLVSGTWSWLVGCWWGEQRGQSGERAARTSRGPEPGLGDTHVASSPISYPTLIDMYRYEFWWHVVLNKASLTNKWIVFLSTILNLKNSACLHYFCFFFLQMTHERVKKKNRQRASEMNLAAILLCIVFLFLVLKSILGSQVGGHSHCDQSVQTQWAECIDD